MNTLWRIVGAAAVVAVLMAVQPACVFACSCLPPGPPQEALATATAVFSGRVTALSAPADGGGPDPVQVTFAVAHGWKGADQRTIVITTPASSASCGVDFVEGQEYLVYASESEGSLQSNLCSRTTLLTMAGEDLAALGAGSVPSSSADGTETPATLPATGRETSPLPVSLAGGALLMVALGAFVATRRHRNTNRAG